MPSILYKYMHRMYKLKLACFNCRKAYKKRYASRRDEANRDVCPQCGGALASMGMHFKVPKQKDVEAWQVAERLVKAGIIYQDDWGYPPGYRPTRLDQVDKFIEEHQRKK